MSSDLSNAIETAAQKPAAATVDGQSATAHPLPDQIAADIHLGNVQSAAPAASGRPQSAWRCLKPARAVPPGAV